MGITDQFFSAMKEVMMLSEKVKSLGEQTKRLETNFQNVDRRVVRLETMVEMAQSQKKLP